MTRVVSITFAAVILVTLASMIVILSRFGTVGEGPEAEEGAKLIFAAIWMMIVACALAFVGWRAMKAPTKFSIGSMLGSVVVYANIAFVCSVYFWNLGAREEEREENDGRFLEEEDGSGDQGEYEEGRGQFILSIVCLVLAAIYTAFAVFILSSKIVFDGDDAIAAEKDVNKSGAYMDILWDGWKFMSFFAIFALFVVFLFAIVSLFFEDDERMREEGDIWNFLIIMLWLFFACVGFQFAGRCVFARSRTINQIQLGAFTGALYCFPGLTLLLAGLYGSSQFDRRHREEGPSGSTGFSFLCLFCSFSYLVFAVLITKHKASIVLAHAHTADDGFDRMEMESDPSDSRTGFVQMDDTKATSKKSWLPWSSRIPDNETNESGKAVEMT